MKKMYHKEHISEMKCYLKDALNQTVDTLNDVRCDIEESVINHDLMPGKTISETSESLIIKVLLPGIKKENIKIDLSESEMILEVTVEMEHYMKGGFFSLSEQQKGNIKRKISLPEKVIPSESKAKLENGILRVEVSKLVKEDLINVKIE
jgi:HSP20 family protein